MTTVISPGVTSPHITPGQPMDGGGGGGGGGDQGGGGQQSGGGGGSSSGGGGGSGAGDVNLNPQDIVGSSAWLLDIQDLIRRALTQGGFNPVFFNSPHMRKLLSYLTGAATTQSALGMGSPGGSPSNVDIVSGLGSAMQNPNQFWSQIQSMQQNPIAMQAFAETPELARIMAQTASAGNLGRQLGFAPYVENVLLPEYRAFAPEYEVAEKTVLDLLQQVMGGNFERLI